MNEIVNAGRHSLAAQVSRHAHRNWEFVYCTQGSGVFLFGHGRLPYRSGDVAVIPPAIPHANTSEAGMGNIYLEIEAPTFTSPDPVVVRCEDVFLRGAFEAALHHFRGEGPQRDVLLRLYGSLICTYLASASTAPTRPSVIDELAQTLEANVGNSDFELDEHMRSLPFSEDYLRRLFQRAFGVSPLRYLTDMRLSRAEMLLVSNTSDSLSVIDVAHACGFRDPLYFSRVFKKKYGVSPTNYPVREP